MSTFSAAVFFLIRAVRSHGNGSNAHALNRIMAVVDNLVPSQEGLSFRTQTAEVWIIFYHDVGLKKSCLLVI